MRITLRAPGATPPPSAQPPGLALSPEEIAALHDELVAYHAEFSPLFARAEQRMWGLKYLEGQLLPIERKSIEPMAEALEGGNVQAMQQFISDGVWDDRVILDHHQRLVAQTLGDPASGVLIIDGCDFPKAGQESVGVAYQWCGPLGKVANCQASVVACYASARGATLVDYRLYLPEPWVRDEAYAARRKKCGVPADVVFHTQPELAWAMIDAVHQQGVLPFAWVTFDEHFGNNPVLLDRVAGAGLFYLAEVPHDTRVWLERPATAVPPATGRGRAPTQPRVDPAAPAPLRVDQLAALVPAEQWQRALIQEGSKGPLVAEVARVRAVAVRDGLPGPDVWVVLRRTLGETPELKTYLCNAPAEVPHETLVWACGRRWPVETMIQQGKEEVGMDHYEVRGWRGWHHHLTMTFLALHFLVRVRCRVGEKITGTHRAASAHPLDGDLAAADARCAGRPGPRPADPVPQLRGLLLPSQAHPAPVGGGDLVGYLVSKLTL
jgi:SRSO17 transposase